MTKKNTAPAPDHWTPEQATRDALEIERRAVNYGAAGWAIASAVDVYRNAERVDTAEAALNFIEAVAAEIGEIGGEAGVRLYRCCGEKMTAVELLAHRAECRA